MAGLGNDNGNGVDTLKQFTIYILPFAADIQSIQHGHPSVRLLIRNVSFFSQLLVGDYVLYKCQRRQLQRIYQDASREASKA